MNEWVEELIEASETIIWTRNDIYSFIISFGTCIWSVHVMSGTMYP